MAREDVLRRAMESADEAAALTQALVRMPTENPPGDTTAATEWLAGFLEARGATVARHPVPAPFARSFGRSGLVNLVVTRDFGPGPTVALHAPLDTLPAGAGWRRDPFSGEIAGGRLWGRGARDAKADIAAFVFATEALIGEAAVSGRVELHLTADEETGGFLGPAFLLGQGLTRPDAVVAAGTSYQVIVGQQGVLHLEVVVHGRQAHAARPGDGVDAVSAALPLLAALVETGRRGPEPLTVGTIAGGRGVNLVADRVSFTVDRRIAPGESGAEVEAALMALVEGARQGEAGVECRRLLLAEPVLPTAESERLADTLSRCAAEVFAREVPVVSAPVVTGARHYALAGIPTALYGVGPPVVGEGADFLGDESVSLDDLSRATAAVALTLVELLGGRA